VGMRERKERKKEMRGGEGQLDFRSLADNIKNHFFSLSMF